jgi:hypothetical protein
MMLKKNLATSRLLAALILGASALFFATGCPEAGTTPNIENPDPDPDPETEPENKAPPSTAGKTIVDGATDQTGRLVSVGKATVAGATTYYIDAVNGNDTWDGKDPLTPWKSFKNINSKTSKNSFKPGDHILLEADSIWNGSPVPATTAWKTFYRSTRVGMIAISNYGTTYGVGNGAAGKPIVIDLYDIKYDGRDDGDPYTATDIKVYYSADKRPIINGGGTPAIPFTSNTHPYSRSGTINFFNAEYWTVRNLELTNTFDNMVTEPDHWRKFGATQTPKKGLDGVDVGSQYGKGEGEKLHNIILENLYIHDVQSEHNNNGGTYYLSDYFKNVYTRTTTTTNQEPDRPGKTVGGIIVAVGQGIIGARVENCIVKKVTMAGIRSAGNNNEDMTFINNYVEQTTGDGMVLSAVLTKGRVESNIIKESCNGNLLGGNYAACWAMNCQDSVFQFNEAYGTLFGNQDGEAWDADNDNKQMVFQYNYSHHNAGGTMLFMTSGCQNNVFRYNISANDGGGTRYMATVDANAPWKSDYNNSSWSYVNGQTIFHYTSTAGSASASLPLIYNNLFYTGDGITTGLFGHNATTGPDKYVRFYNNIVIKEGTGTLYLSYGHNGNGHAGKITNPAGVKHNLFWGYDTDPNVGNIAKFNNGTGASPSDLFAATYSGLTLNNKWENPKLVITESGTHTQAVADLRTQRDTVYAETGDNFTNMTKLTTFTAKERLRNRASIFAPVTGSPVLAAGMDIPVGNAGAAGQSAVDNAWNAISNAALYYDVSKDFFGHALGSSTPIGPANAPYAATGSVTD